MPDTKTIKCPNCESTYVVNKRCGSYKCLSCNTTIINSMPKRTPDTQVCNDCDSRENRFCGQFEVYIHTDEKTHGDVRKRIKAFIDELKKEREKNASK
ncbi:hypothetical protein LCGC14_0579930 [marine sediment metagenome]|uniref:Uncharacterized protein n=1 Tax=marine sediment metagenome TaxID=412755 RepID=A0A0F9U2Y7_9ZZZZ